MCIRDRPRADRRDSLVGAQSIAAIPQGATVGTSAPRRAAQLRNLRPDCRVVMFRGNVATRLAKLEAGAADVTFLAAAGLARLGQSKAGNPLSEKDWIPAAGQGAIVLETRSEDATTVAAISALDDATTRFELEAERALLSALGGTCHSPVAVLCHLHSTNIAMQAALFSPDGSERVDGDIRFVAGDHGPVRDLAAQLLHQASPAIKQHFGQS